MGKLVAQFLQHLQLNTLFKVSQGHAFVQGQYLENGATKRNKARNSHKPRLGEYVQQGNIRSITYIIRGVLFHFLFKKIVSKNI